MTDDLSLCKEEVEHIQKRVRKLAMEKSWLQLIISLMNKLTMNPALETTIDSMLRNTIEVIGGTNAIIHYFIDHKIYYADALGSKKQLEKISDQRVIEVLDKGSYIETEGEFDKTMMLTHAFSQSWTWAYPLKVGGETIGVFLIENMHLGVRDLRDFLPTFFNYAAMILNNLIRDYTRLKKINEDLNNANQSLQQEIAERKKYEAMLSRSKKEAEEANRSKSIFLANMSHELRTPLNAVLGFSQLMQDDPTTNEDQRSNLSIINHSGEHLLTLINDVLEMSKIEAGHIIVEPRPIDLGELVREILDMMKNRAEAKNLQLLFEQTSDFPRFVSADAPKLRQIIINLLSNAVKFTEQGSVILRLGLAPQEDANQLKLLCEVEDSGVGLSPADQERIFHPFIQVGQTDKQTGTGLGLAITRQYVQLMGGTLEVHSEPAKGSLFTASIIVGTANKNEIEPLLASKGKVLALEPGQPEYRILSVEDKWENQLLLTNILESIGFKVKCVNNGQEAVAAFTQWHPHLIWMDRRMPIMDGLEATQQIRKLAGGREVIIIALTASVFKEQMTELLDAGLDDFIRKPYKVEELLDCMAKHLGVRYLYKENKDITHDSPKAKLTAEMLNSIPNYLLTTLRKAACELDFELTMSIIDKIKHEDVHIGARLQELLDQFDFKAIQELLEK